MVTWLAAARLRWSFVVRNRYWSTQIDRDPSTASWGQMMRAFESNLYVPPTASKSRSPAASKGSKSGVRLVVSAICCLWSLLCTLWFCAAMYELIRFTMLDDAYGQHTSVFRMAYAKSAAIAILLGVPTAIVFFRIQRQSPVYGNGSCSDDDCAVE